MSEKITARDIGDLLRQKHTGDVFIDECKDGPTQGVSHVRLDAWAMKRSWSNPCYYGYEIKVSRSDFLGDEKWHEYLPLCNKFSFVAPKGVIEPGEIPECAGLIQVASTGTRLFTKKKAPHREIEQPVPLLLYALMRAGSFEVYSTGDSREANARYWERWLKSKRDLREIGRRVGKAMRERIREEVDEAKLENKELRHKLEKLEGAKLTLDRMGVDLSSWRLDDEIVAAASGVQRDMVLAARRLRSTVDSFLETADELEEKAQTPVQIEHEANEGYGV
jgi:hypothetical protein